MICLYGEVEFLDLALQYGADLTEIDERSLFITILDAAILSPLLTITWAVFQQLQRILNTNMTEYTGR